MKKWDKKYWKMINVGLFIIVVVPIIVYGLSVIPLLPAGENNDWAGFWGGYLGSIVGGIASFLILYITIQHESAQNEKETRIEFFDRIIEYFAEYKKSAGNICAYVTKYYYTYKKDEYDRVITETNSLSALSIKIQLMMESRKEKYDLKYLISRFEDFEIMFDSFIDKFENYKLSEQEADVIANKILKEVVNLENDVQKEIKIKLNEKIN